MATHKIGTLPDRWDVAHLSGQRFELRIPVLDATGSSPALADLTRARVHVRPFVDAPDILFIFDTEADPPNAELVEDAGAVSVVATASAAEVSDWQITWPGQNGESVVWWDVEVVDTTGEPHQLTRPGTITLTHEVTR